MSGDETNIPELYARLHKRYTEEKPKAHDLLAESMKINTYLRPDQSNNDPDTYLVANIIYLLICHHCSLTGSFDRNNVPYRGKLIAGNKCPKFDFRALPPTLQIIIIKFMEEVTS